jgi:hypothetical protein
MFGKYNGFVSKARVSACMYFLVLDYKREIDSPKGDWAVNIPRVI